MPPLHVVPLDSAEATLEHVGGKGRGLATLVAGGLPVPNGFLITTAAYRDHVEANKLQPAIAAALDSDRDSGRRERAIRRAFAATSVPDPIRDAIVAAYADLGTGFCAVAVRSSATAEDLPELSFAGQHDSFLNIRGEDALLAAVADCWVSLWNERAIAYREQMGINHAAVAMGVAVQKLVAADVAGVMFTANPTTGERAELVVTAAFGLGESVVDGSVTPDTYVVDRSGTILSEHLGNKHQQVVATGHSGTSRLSVAESDQRQPALSSSTLAELARFGAAVEALFDDVPQDIEFAVEAGNCWLLQARPITRLPAPPLRDVSWPLPYVGAKLIRRQVVENMPEPLSPLFAELYLTDGLDQAIETFLAAFGLPIEPSDLNDMIPRPIFVTVNGYAYSHADFHFGWRNLAMVPKLVFWYFKALPRIVGRAESLWRDEGLAAYQAAIERWRHLDSPTDDHRLRAIRELALADARYWYYVAIAVGLAKISEELLHRFVTSRLVPGTLTSGAFLRGFASPTLAAQHELDALAAAIPEHLHDQVRNTPPDQLLRTLAAMDGGRAVVDAIEAHLHRYGHLVYTLDFAEPTQVDAPRPVLAALQALTGVDGPTIESRQAAVIEDRERLTRSTTLRLGPVRRWLFRKFLRWAQRFGPLREEALHYMGAGWPTLRRHALEVGASLVDVGTLAAPELVFYLDSSELADACSAKDAGQRRADLGALAEQRQLLRESRKRLHPPGVLPPGSRWKMGPFDFSAFETQKRNVDDSTSLEGFPVSPGKVTAPASLVLSAADFDQMQPGSILVCPTTTPAWTPLFAKASGLVTDIGGILAHGSIVAREYGIPAVMGTGNGTQRIASGQTITVDGDTGTVVLSDASEPRR